MKTIENTQIRRMLVVTGMAFSSLILFSANSATIKGRVTDRNNQPVEYATAVLKNPATDKFVTGTVCNDKGEYEFENVEPGEYILSTDMIGYHETNASKLTVKENPDRPFKQIVVMNENPDRSITVVAKRRISQNDNQTAQR